MYYSRKMLNHKMLILNVTEIQNTKKPGLKGGGLSPGLRGDIAVIPKEFDFKNLILKISLKTTVSFSCTALF